MADIVSYVGMFTGITGSILGYLGYRGSNENTDSDRRLELHKLRNVAHVTGVSLIELMPKVLQSHQAVLNAQGAFNSGTMAIFRDPYDSDYSKAIDFGKQVPSIDETFYSLRRDELDQKIVALDRFKHWIDELFGKYQSVLDEDDKIRAEIRAANIRH